ncbi:hypothetical protein IB265_34515 [Ensifer sp. ENS10]|uniref:hypothetical protein n=1 Tax=unclassified Ensifer TaxID=2633371 RepID=UPI00070C50A3|nr:MULTISPECIES: hypothetical protein [unclassified Ensifer]KRD49028.1 hypothetical protein ASE60_20985 [Ensifer sp. Root278]MBD9511867.1 hypothetical protein [Ensifer sp. ENS10]
MLARSIQAVAEGLPRDRLVEAVDRLCGTRNLAQALIMAAEGTTGCDETEINAISHLAYTLSQEVRKANDLISLALKESHQ